MPVCTKERWLNRHTIHFESFTSSTSLCKDNSIHNEWYQSRVDCDCPSKRWSTKRLYNTTYVPELTCNFKLLTGPYANAFSVRRALPTALSELVHLSRQNSSIRVSMLLSQPLGRPKTSQSCTRNPGRSLPGLSSFASCAYCSCAAPPERGSLPHALALRILRTLAAQWRSSSAISAYSFFAEWDRVLLLNKFCPVLPRF